MIIACIEDHKGDLFLIDWYLKQIIPQITIHSYPYLNDFLKTDKPYDLIVTDLTLPDCYGPEIITKIRKITKKPIIVFSGIGGRDVPHDIIHSLKHSGATLFVSKSDDGYALLAQSLHQFN